MKLPAQALGVLNGISYILHPSVTRNPGWPIEADNPYIVEPRHTGAPVYIIRKGLSITFRISDKINGTALGTNGCTKSGTRNRSPTVSIEINGKKTKTAVRRDFISKKGLFFPTWKVSGCHKTDG
jgi:hypothetical protein